MSCYLTACQTQQRLQHLPLVFFPHNPAVFKKRQIYHISLCKHDMIEGNARMEMCSGCARDSPQHVPNTPNWYRVYLGAVIPTHTWRLLTLESMNAPSLSPHTPL